MAVSWIDYINGEGLLSIRNKINAFNNAVVTEVGTILSNITSLSASISTNTTNIATNAANIATNTADIVDLQTKAPFIPTYDYNKATAITVPSDTYTEVIRLTTPSRVAGTYQLNRAMLYSLNSTTTSAFFRFSTDGGATWVEVRREPKDNLDIVPLVYTSPVVHAGGVFEIIVQARKESAGDTLYIASVDLSFERKL